MQGTAAGHAAHAASSEKFPGSRAATLAAADARVAAARAALARMDALRGALACGASCYLHDYVNITDNAEFNRVYHQAQHIGAGLAILALFVPEFVAGLASSGAGLLARSEAAGGHLIARHVGLDAAALDARIAAQAHINVASSFSTVAQAEATAAAALSRNAAAISSWVKAGAVGRLPITTPFTGGIIRVVGGYSAEATGAMFILQGNGAGAYHILTGFPIP